MWKDLKWLRRRAIMGRFLVVAVLLLAKTVKKAAAWSSFHAPPPILPRGSSFSGGSPSWSSQLPPRAFTKLHVSVGLGPSKDEPQQAPPGTTVATADGTSATEVVEEYEIPDHESYRTSRRSKLDERCDQWFEQLLQSSSEGCLGALANNARTILTTPVPLLNDYEQSDRSHPDWTPYVSTKLPWTPLVPAYGLEQFGLPIPRRGSEAWRQFDVPGMIAQACDTPMTCPEPLLETDRLEQLRHQLQTKGSWLNDEDCDGRLVYLNGQYVDALSKSTSHVYNLNTCPDPESDLYHYLGLLTDGFTDELLVVDDEQRSERSYQRLSGPNHKVGPPISQFAVNTQQGSACFAALNTIQVPHVAVVRASPTVDATEINPQSQKLPVLVVQAFTPCGGSDLEAAAGGSLGHLRVVAVAEEHSELSLLLSQVDVLENGSSEDGDTTSAAASSFHTPKLVNAYTQLVAHPSSNVTLALLDEVGGFVTPLVERGDDDPIPDSFQGRAPREIEAERPQLRDTILNIVDAHVCRDASLTCTAVQMGGSGRHRLALSAALLQKGASATVNGFSLSGGLQRSDVKTHLHHVAPSTVSRQFQKNLIGGRATASFRGRIRVEQDAQQTDSYQLSRAILLTDKARAWAVPSLEIIADDVKCSHGTTVSDLSEEELFYLTSRGIDRPTARKLLMYAFCSDVTSAVGPAWQSQVRDKVLGKLERLVPQGDRAVQGEFQSI